MSFFIALIIGIAVGQLSGFSFAIIPGYEMLLYALLGVGLYGAVYGIDLDEFKIHKKIILSAITFGVVLKGLLIGGILWYFLESPIAFLLGMIVAQIDPLSVTKLVDKKSEQFSTGGRTILRAWSSFDDPMTVLLALYIFLPIAIGTSFSFDIYSIQLLSNIAFAGIFYLLSKFIPSKILIIPAFLIAVPFQLMLGIAMCGLFLRPKMDFLPKVIDVSFILSALILGSLFLFETNNILLGLLLGVSAFIAQILAAFIVARNLSKNDKLFLAFGQYNGITSVILALVVGVMFPQVIVIVAAAVVTINLLYYSSNYLLERRLG